MIPKYKTRANLILTAGFVLVLIGGAMNGPQNNPDNSSGFAALLVLTGLAIWLVGCQQYCMAKAQPGWKAIYGIVFPLGLIALTLLPDEGQESPKKSRPQKKARRRRPRYDEDNGDH